MYDGLSASAAEFDQEAAIAFNRLFYLATAPGVLRVDREALGEHGLDKHEGAEVRLVVEKPFGTTSRRRRS